MSVTGGEQSSTGLNPNVAAVLCYVLGFISGVIFLVIEKNSPFVRFHAMQSTIFFGGLCAAMFFLTFIPLLGWLINLVLTILGFVLWIVLMVKAYQGDRFKLPVVGDIAASQVA